MIKIHAAARLKAGWFDALSDAAKKAYLKLHPNSKQGKSSGGDGLEAARKAYEKAKAAAEAMHKRMGDDSTDAEWDQYDKLQERLRKAGEHYRKLKGK